jgi:hypothetical protein
MVDANVCHFVNYYSTDEAIERALDVSPWLPTRDQESDVFAERGGGGQAGDVFLPNGHGTHQGKLQKTRRKAGGSDVCVLRSKSF